MDELLRLLLGPFGTLVLALTILVTGWKKMWVFGWYAREVERRENEWREIALRGTKIAEVVTSALKENGPK